MEILKINWIQGSAYNEWDNGRWEELPKGSQDLAWLKKPVGPNPTKIVGVKKGEEIDLGYLCRDIVWVVGEEVIEDYQEAVTHNYEWGGVIPCHKDDSNAIQAALDKVEAKIMAVLRSEE